MAAAALAMAAATGRGQAPTAPAAKPSVKMLSMTGAPDTKSAPYDVVVKITTERKGSDGKPVVQEREERRMSDGNGRVRTEYGQLQGGVFRAEVIQIKDYKSWTLTIWKPEERTARMGRLDGMFSEGPIMMPVTRAEGLARREKEAPARAYRNAHPDSDTEEKLGSRMLAGVPAEGTRSTRVIHEEVDGRDRAITIVSESWMNSELRLDMLQKLDDPRTGLTTETVAGLHRGEQDPKLFEVPAGYAVVDVAKDDSAK